jgi:hypothetical protein
MSWSNNLVSTLTRSQHASVLAVAVAVAVVGGAALIAVAIMSIYFM